jgi:hypothetical protein
MVLFHWQWDCMHFVALNLNPLIHTNWREINTVYRPSYEDNANLNHYWLYFQGLHLPKGLHLTQSIAPSGERTYLSNWTDKWQVVFVDILMEDYGAKRSFVRKGNFSIWQINTWGRCRPRIHLSPRGARTRANFLREPCTEQSGTGFWTVLSRSHTTDCLLFNSSPVAGGLNGLNWANGFLGFTGWITSSKRALQF